MMIFCMLQTCRLCCLKLCLNNSHSHLIQALLFTKSGFFVNLACASPNVFISDFGHLKIKESGSQDLDSSFLSGILPWHHDVGEDLILWQPVLHDFCWRSVFHYLFQDCSVLEKGISWSNVIWTGDWLDGTVAWGIRGLEVCFAALTILLISCWALPHVLTCFQLLSTILEPHYLF